MEFNSVCSHMSNKEIGRLRSGSPFFFITGNLLIWLILRFAYFRETERIIDKL